MKIAHITCAYPPYRSGISHAVFEIARENIKSGHEVCVFTPDYGRLSDSGQPEAVRLKPLIKYGNAAFVPQLLWVLNGFDIAIVHYPFFGGAETAWLGLLGRSRPKLVVHFHMDTASLPPAAKLLSQPLNLFKPLILKKAETIICASLDYVKNSSLAGYYRAHPDKFCEIPFGVSLERFSPAEKPRPAETAILFVGALDKAHAFKGVEVLIRAMSMIRETAGGWRLRIVGDGDLRPAIENMAKEFGLAGKTEFLGLVSDSRLPEIYRESDIFVLPSVSSNEAFGIVLLEAMASGLPVIASDLPGVRSVFEDNVQGWRVKPGDARDLGAKLELLISNQDERQRMGLAGRRLGKKKYDWKQIGRLYDQAVRKTAND